MAEGPICFAGRAFSFFNRRSKIRVSLTDFGLAAARELPPVFIQVAANKDRSIHAVNYCCQHGKTLTRVAHVVPCLCGRKAEALDRDSRRTSRAVTDGYGSPVRPDRDTQT